MAAAGGGARPSLGVAGVEGLSLGSPSFPRPPPGQALVGHSWDCSGRLTSSHSSLLFFYVVIGTPWCPSLPFWRPRFALWSLFICPWLFFFCTEMTIVWIRPFFFFPPAQETEAAQQVQFCWSICFRQGSMVTATPTPLRPEVIRVTSLQVSVSGS